MQKLINMNRVDFCFWALLFVFVIANVLVVFINPMPEWDESVYIGMGKYIYSFGKAGAWEAMRPITLPLVVGFFWKIGLNPVYGAKIAAIIFSASTLILVFFIGKKLSSPISGFAASITLMLTPAFIFHSTYGLTEVPSTLFALAALCLVIKKANYFSVGFFAGLAFLFKFPQGIFLLILLFGILLFFRKNIKLMLSSSFFCCLGFLAALTPFLIFNYFLYRADVNAIVAMLRPMLFAVGEQANPFYQGSLLFYPFKLLSSNPFLLFSLLGVTFFFKKREFSFPSTMLVIGAFLFLLYFSILPNKQLRFTLIFLPYLSLLAGFGFNEIIKKRLFRYFALIFILAVCVPNIAVGISNLGLFEAKDFFMVEFYSYFSMHPAEGKVITTIPYPLAYSDTLFYPIYYPPERPFSELVGGVSDVVFVPSVMLCREEDTPCQERGESFSAAVKSNKKVFSREYYGNSFDIYKVI